MARNQNLYQIYKLSSTFICENNLDIKSYTKKQAIKDGALVSLGDNILFDRIRAYRGDNRTPKEIFNEVAFLRFALKKNKKEGNIKEAKIINRKILDTLFVKDIINVEARTKTEYRRVAKTGFYVNGIRYVQFSCGAGQARRQTVTFINEELYEPMFKLLACGIDEKVKEINLAKFSAYFALTSSSILWVDTPRCCVIKDFETTIPNQKIDWIEKDENGEGYIVEKIEDITLNSADGQGLVSPEMAERWAKNMELDYIPSQFVARSAYIKGDFVVFDFKEYAKRHGISRIYDIYGVGYDINEIDCLISESQFKMYKYYSSWQEYLSYSHDKGIKWGIARYNKKEDPIYTMINYQFLQILDLSTDDIKELIRPTVDWIKNVCSGNKLYSLLYSIGGFKDISIEEMSYNDVYARAQNLSMQAVIKDSNFLGDTYVQGKIYKNIIETINRAKIGKIWVRGNYQFAVSDPIPQCRSALGLDPKGEIPADHVYSNFWNNRGSSGNVFIGRNPCIDEHEANVCTLYRSEESDYWYRYLKSGIIFSIYDTATIRAEDADFDGDIYATYDNPILVKGVKKDSTNIIMYAKKKAPNHKINHSNLVESYIKGFGNKVGTYSNDATIIETMKALFTKPEQKERRDELERRKKLLREIVGAEIDSTKGLGKPKEPWYFRTFRQIDPDDDDITKSEKYYHNSLVISKKPYFFRYLYPELNKKYKQYENSYNEVSKCKFGIKFKKLLLKEEKTEEEQKLVKRYHKFSPLINSNCTMNILCREFEDVDFDIQYNKRNVSMLPYIENYKIDKNILNIFVAMYRKYSNRKALVFINNFYEGIPEDDYKEIRFGALDAIRAEIKKDFEDLEISVLEGLTYIKELSKRYGKFNWGFAWDLFESDILDCIETKDALIPVEVGEEEDGAEYLGRKYILVSIPKEENNLILDEETGEVLFYED